MNQELPDVQTGFGKGKGTRHPGMQSQVGLESITMNKASGGDGIPVQLF